MTTTTTATTTDFGTFGRFTETPVNEMDADTRSAYEFTRELRGLVPGPHRIWLANPKLSRTIVPTGAYYETESTLSKAEIEIATNVINGHWRAAYSNYEHEKIGEQEGHLPAEKVEALIAGLPTAFDDPRQQVVYELALTLAEARVVPGGLYRRARDLLGDAGIVDVTALMGWFTTVSLTLMAFDVPSSATTGTIDLLGILSASQALSSQTTIADLHARVVDVLGAMTGATRVHMLLWNDDRQNWLRPAAPLSATGDEGAVPMSVLRYVERTREPLVVDDGTRDDRFARDPYFAEVESCSLLAVPILTRGTLRAVLVLENRLIRGAFTADRLDAVKLIAGQLLVSLDNAESRAQLIGSRARIVAAGDDTRRRIQRDLHDGAQQRVVTLALRLKMLAASDAARASGLYAELQELIADANDALNELRDLAHGLLPPALSRGGLRPALTALAERSPIPVALDLRVAGRLAEPVEIAAYYVVAEMLTNAAKHADASRVEVHVDVVDSAVRVSVRDDGVGGAEPARGSGLVGLRDRVEALGGTITLDSPQGEGTTLIAQLPLADTIDSAPDSPGE